MLGAEHLLRNTQNGNTQWFSLKDVNLLRKSMVSYIEKTALENLSSSSPDRLISEDLEYNSLCLDSSFISVSSIDPDEQNPALNEHVGHCTDHNRLSQE